METQLNPQTHPLKLYVCGPTVYDESHLGHARTYMTVDVLNRIMNTFDNKPTQLVMNITDIDDKIINKACTINTTWNTVAKKYEKSFFDAMAKLNVKLPDVIIRVSAVIPQIITYIQKIIDNGFAYVTSDQSIYFDTNAYISHGYSFNNYIDDDEQAYHSTLSTVIRLQKRNPKDFALWKGRLEAEVGFDAEFMYNSSKIKSFGRPGWHIECSTMIHETIGPNLDIHFGGIDLKFPHHYNERLQAHAFYHPMFLNQETQTAQPIQTTQLNQWTNSFLHVGHLCIKGLKMSKSLKNFTTIDEALREINANQLRWMFTFHKWTDPMDFSDDTVAQARVFDTMMTNFLNRIINYPFDRSHVTYNDKENNLNDYFMIANNKIISELRTFNLDSANFMIFELINKTNAYIDMATPNESLVRKIYDWILNLVSNLGYSYQKSAAHSITDVMDVLISTRSELRSLSRDKNVAADTKQKIFKILDYERNLLLPDIGIILQDTKDSSSWFKKE